MSDSKIDLKLAYAQEDRYWRGFIWDPKNSSNKAHCTITVKNGEPIAVECWKDLKIFEHFYQSLNFHQPIEFLFGETEEGRSFTILNIVLENFRRGSGIPSIKIVGEFLIHGFALNPRYENVEGVYFRLQYLDEWLNKNPVSIYPSKKNEYKSFVVKVNIPDKLKLFESPVLKLSIGHRFSYPGQPVNRLKIYPIPFVAIDFINPVSISKSILFRDAIYHLLKSFVGVETKVTESIIKTGEDQFHEIYSFDKKLQWSYSNFSSRNILLNVETLKPHFEQVISNWLQVYEDNNEAIKEYYRISASRDFVNKRELFINATQGVEMFFKIFNPQIKVENKVNSDRKKGDFWKKIETFLILLEPIISEIIPNKEIFIKKIVDTRNHFSHYNLTSRKEDPYIIPSRLIGAYTKRLELMNSFLLLYQLGIPLNQISNGFKKHINYFIFRDEIRIFE